MPVKSSNAAMERAVTSKTPASNEKAVAPEAAKRSYKGATAQEMSSRQRDISVAEFFQKNRHLLGFDNPRKALLTTVKEAVDNSLDACEEAKVRRVDRPEASGTKGTWQEATLQELAEQIGVHRQTAYGWLRRGKLKGRIVKVGTQRIWLVSLSHASTGIRTGESS